MKYETKITDTYALEGVSLEANFIGNAVNAALKYLPSLYKSVKAGFSQLTNLTNFVGSSEDTSVAALTSKEKKIVSLLEFTPYDDLIKLRLHCPEGFSADYVSYVLDVIKALEYNQTTIKDSLNEYYTTVAAVITNKEQKLSTKDLSSQYKAMNDSRSALNESLAKYFTAKSSQAEQPYGTLFTSNKDVEMLFRKRHEMLKKLSSLDLAGIKSQASKITDALKTLVELIDSGSVEFLSPAQLKNITTGAYEAAAMAELYAVNYYRAMTVGNTILHLQDKLLTRLEVK